MRRFATLPLMHEPGERWRYNTGSEVLSVLLARASGKPLEVLFRERIFEPLGMMDTGFSVPPEKIDRLATSYWGDPSTGALAVFDEPSGKWSRPPAFPSGAGGLVATIDDYFAFGRMLLRGGEHGGARILSKASVEAMTSDQMTPEQKARSQDSLAPGFWDPRGWGFGVSIRTGGQTPGRFGWDGGLGTSWSSDPKNDVVAILMTQRGAYPDMSGVYLDFWRTTCEAVLG
jgi:CubicO group peptidase (beta-lactamase class C family)